MDATSVVNAAIANVNDAFRGRNVFVTGATGFVGKVFLYKLLKEFPDIGDIYVMVRGKKNVAPIDRLNKEIWASQAFEPLKRAIGEEEFKRRQAKVKPVTGDMLLERLGFDNATYEMLTQKLNYIFHLAATIDFQEKLDVSVRLNVLGSLRVQTMAHRCSKLEAFVHVSTCYVNWNRSGREVPVKEVLYPLPFDAEGMCKRILSLSPAHVVVETKMLLEQYKYPNTYTFTKSMGEHLLYKYKGNLPMVIVRPAIVGCALVEPSPGYIDVLTAAGGIILTAGLGVLNEMSAGPHHLADIVPVDFVVNTMIKAAYKCNLHYARARNSKALSTATTSATSSAVALSAPLSDAVKAMPSASPAAISATSLTVANAAPRALGVSTSPSNDSNEDALTAPAGVLPFVFASSTSGTMNPLTWETFRIAITSYWNANPHPKRMKVSEAQLIHSPVEYHLKLFFKRKLPLMLMQAATSLPYFGSKERRLLVDRYAKALHRTIDMNFQFSPFTLYEWRFDNENQRVLDDNLSAGELKRFGTDVFDINWATYSDLYSYGIIQYVMKAPDGRAPPKAPPSGSEQFLRAHL